MSELGKRNSSWTASFQFHCHLEKTLYLRLLTEACDSPFSVSTETFPDSRDSVAVTLTGVMPACSCEIQSRALHAVWVPNDLCHKACDPWIAITTTTSGNRSFKTRDVPASREIVHNRTWSGSSRLHAWLQASRLSNCGVQDISTVSRQITH